MANWILPNRLGDQKRGNNSEIGGFHLINKQI